MFWISLFLAGAIGVYASAVLNAPFYTWQFWGLLVLVVAHAVTFALSQEG